jgi:hypothetical protein
MHEALCNSCVLNLILRAKFTTFFKKLVFVLTGENKLHIFENRRHRCGRRGGVAYHSFKELRNRSGLIVLVTTHQMLHIDLNILISQVSEYCGKM